MFEKNEGIKINKNKSQQQNLGLFMFSFQLNECLRSEIYLLLSNNIGLTSQYQNLTKNPHETHKIALYA